ncbi:BamA/TamA family outer membrane protein [Agaribacterium haliotis]|uniref:BamA/TamA family outer membrane protein n=1 Tax=Agaribacterium haliotis TaxID=2013869 RepID=UPI000BB55D8C|nr:BamA/TamA family outer membrane protein [Agaribacterium haliotis]
MLKLLLFRPCIYTVFFSIFSPLIWAQNEPGDDAVKPADQESPWLATPIFSADPKLGASIGAMGAYLFKADSESPSSMLGLMGTYSNTDSTIYGLFSRNYFAKDRQRFVAGAFGGRIENDYGDFLGTGVDVKTRDELGGVFTRYSVRTKEHWFVGAQLVAMDYKIEGKDSFSRALLKLLGLEGFKSNGLGAVLERDSRDNQNSPSSGSLFNFNNIAYSEKLGGDESFDTYDLGYSIYRAHGNGNVIAAQIKGRWTAGAPRAAYSSVNLRGYTRGEYLGKNSVMFQLEERYRLSERWGLSAFAGVACLYGNDKKCSDDDNLFPALGAGVNFMLKKQEKMIVRAELAAGKYQNHGFYIQFGNAF